MSTSLFNQTPMVTVRDNRNLAVREIAFLRHPDTPQVTDTRITYHRHDARGFLTQSTDPRLHEAGVVNFTYLTSLAGEVLRTQSVDAGTSLALSDVAGRPCLTLHNLSPDNDEPPVTRTWQYEDASLPGRPLYVTEQVAGAPARIIERFVWAGPTPEAQAQNLAGQCIRHYDPAGLVRTERIALTGVSQSVTRQLLKNADSPDTLVDWQGEDDAGLEPDPYTTQTTADATGAVLSTQDAAGHKQRLCYDVAGQLAGSWLTLKGGTEQVIVKSLHYSAAGQKLREEHGNGVVTTYTYEPKTQRLASIKTERQGSGAKVLQDLRYAYDPVGNVVSVRNDAEATRFWRNQKVVPENTYAYPFGGTAVWTHRNAVEASYKTVRYSGKERDATGLYYYGYRYYQSWAGRWLSTDPAGTVDGLNLYRMVKNNPVTWRDGDGREQAVGPLAPDGTPLAKLFESGDIVYGLDAPRKKAVAALEGVGVKRKEAKASPTGMLRLFKKKKERSNIVIQNDITDAVWDPGNPTQYAQDKDIKNHLHDFKRGISFREFLKSHAAYNVKELEGARQLKENPSLVMKLGPELWKKTSKAGLAFQLLDQKKTVHFVVDIIEDTLAGVASKTKGPGTSITSSELRWLYRHRALPEVQANLIFYREGKKISQDEIFGRPEWENYKPKNSTRRAGV